MIIYRIETTIIPQTVEGRKFADEYEERLRIDGSDSDGSQGSQMGSQGSQVSESEEQA